MKPTVRTNEQNRRFWHEMAARWDREADKLTDPELLARWRKRAADCRAQAATYA